MALIGLLLAALGCIVVGVVFASGPWFVGSLIASALAGYFLYRQRDQITGRSADRADSSSGGQSSSDSAPSRQTALVTGTAFQANAASTESPAGGSATASAAPSPVTAGPNTAGPNTAGSVAVGPVTAGPALELPAGTTVWVVDGEPQFHTEDCGRIAALSPESIPYPQAVADGFTECSACSPVAAARASSAASATQQFSAAAAPPSVPAESAPTDRQPRPAPSPAAPDGTDDVWVVDGRPRFHLRDCLSIKDQPAEPIPADQASEDGFIPCTMCEPNVTRV